MKEINDILQWEALPFEENGTKRFELRLTQEVQIKEGPQSLCFTVPDIFPRDALCLITGFDSDGMKGDDGWFHDAEVRVSVVPTPVAGGRLEVRLYSYESFCLAKGSFIARVWLLSPYREV